MANMAKVKVHNKQAHLAQLESVLAVIRWCVTVLALLLLTAAGSVQLEANSIVPGVNTHHHPHHTRHHLHREVTKQEFDSIGDGGGGGGGGGDADAAHQKFMNGGNYILIDYLNDGERERRISWNGIIGKETSLADNSSNKTLSLWQMVSNNYLIQIIYNSEGQMMDCEYVRQRTMVHQFRSRFASEFSQARARNFTSPFSGATAGTHHSLVSDHDFEQYIEHDIVTPEMEELQYNVFEFPAGVPATHQTIDAFGMRNLTYIPLHAREAIPADLLELLNFRELKQRCNVRHMQLKQIAQGLQSSDPEHQRIANENLQRQRRDLSSMLRVPGTKWCGKGWSARSYVEMGGYSKADRCCRQHDLSCPFWILGFETKYNLFNWRVNTLMHCGCDERFRTCLKMADSSDANLVGKLFFNIVQMKCFVLKPETVCVKRTWWNKCEKKIRRKRAHLRDNRKF
ncbi:uncharacterized protein LOC118506298 isoform X1 [Anopheles stephensi]|uniref:uncharacterized protein LOC118506298 isoform X1 n=1 Tax=Anopheles stephensi TaxID=30069 RepID=UPI001658994D|nr:uncharacterized protein LOC118506298 isoform X1 [Anopheles stephensi]XP_035899132.1 uncharacterized protein LOC118506298 isoform X1 [Anopheles stephensi]XP_035899133.1 uncharacterized protein LOC118506298 isoform X1 [Anopheles stephensi]XP_035899134.1 uncharacterized protein LOC118506298 isoform X1 [Anopheles stephensi]XP_035899136.1 uncharacterized protein LOC118506298 isoform X1 [Anopheles stephensi]